MMLTEDHGRPRTLKKFHDVFSKSSKEIIICVDGVSARFILSFVDHTFWLSVFSWVVLSSWSWNSSFYTLSVVFLVADEVCAKNRQGQVLSGNFPKGCRVIIRAVCIPKKI
jgi:hypothetical protein